MALITVRFFSNTLHMCASATVLLPESAPPENGFRTLLLLHGMTDNHTAWTRYTSIERYAAARNLAVIMPDAHLSCYADMAYGNRYYTHIAEEVPEIMRSFFPALSKRPEDNYVAGLSMGGGGALRIGLTNPERYAAIGVFSAAIYSARDFEAIRQKNPGKFAEFELVFGEGCPIKGTQSDAFFLANQAVRSGARLPRVYHTCGAQDGLAGENRAASDFFASLPGNPFSYVYEEYDGVHDWAFWDAAIQRYLCFIG